jgi:GTPase Era involved in 16S rRNA processing
VQNIADLLLKGYAIELMDGDNSFIWMTWIKAVLNALDTSIRKEVGRKDNAQGIALSIMGLQSSGKSTMLNSMFNSKFAVAAGRCTKGIYMLPVMLDKELRAQFNNQFDYILMFDTEGLRAMELGMSNDNRVKDNEMATTSVSVADVTLINSMRMQNTELYELLGIVSTAILKFQQKDNAFLRKQEEHKNEETDLKDAFRVSGIFVN